MTETHTNLRCPECDGPITAAQFAAEGLCADCVDKAVETMPSPRDMGHGAPAENGEAQGETTDLEPAGAVDQEATESDAAMSLVMSTMIGFALGAEAANAQLYLCAPDEFCNMAGDLFDVVQVEAARFLDVFLPDWRERVAESE